MRSFVFFLFGSLLIAATVTGAQPEFWTLDSANDYLAGESEGFAIGARGHLLPGPAMTKVASFTEPFVLSQAAGREGTRFVGTGNEGNVYRIRGGEAELLFTAPEAEVYALAFREGSLFVGSSPYGKIYEVDPSTGESSVFFDPEEAYIWAIVPLADGSLAVGTGVEGRLWKVSPGGEGVVLFDGPETHIRSLAAGGGRLIAGGAGEGRIYAVDPDGDGRALFDSDFSEIAALWIDPSSGVAWAAGVTSTLPTAAPPKQEPQPRPATTSTNQQQQQQQQREDTPQAPSPTVDVSFSFDQPSTGSGGGSSEIYRIDPDGLVTPIQKLERELVYSLAGRGDGSLIVGTGPLGRIYRLRDRELTLLATVPEKQIVSAAADGNAMVVTTTNAGAVYRLTPEAAGNAEYRSVVKDTARFSTFGEYRLEGEALTAAQSAFRSGNTSTPDETWSEWTATSGATGRITAPPARYLQWRLTLDRIPTGFRVDSMTASFMNRNLAPVIESLTVNDPGVVFISGAYPASPQVLEATNPDQYGIFNTLDTPQERNEPGKRLFRKGYRTVSWKASDPNGDPLRYSVWFRREGATEWLRLRENIEETQINFDTSQLPDGDYEVRVVATDERENPELPLSAEREGVDFTIDNSAPTFDIRRDGDAVIVTVRDALSPVTRAEYAEDAEKWIRILPVDGLADSREETFRFDRDELEGRFVILRVVDTSWNSAADTVTP